MLKIPKMLAAREIAILAKTTDAKGKGGNKL
jgi:hypothetical protein